MADELTIRAEAIVLASPDELIEHPRNARAGDVGAISQSIRVNGYMAPVIVQRSTRHVIDGNHRVQAARALGMSKIPVVWVDIDDDTALRYLLAANRANDLASYDSHALIALLTDLQQQTELGLDGTAWTPDDLDHLIMDVTQDITAVENEPTLPDEGRGWVTCPACGHHWKLGNE